MDDAVARSELRHQLKQQARAHGLASFEPSTVASEDVEIEDDVRTASEDTATFAGLRDGRTFDPGGLVFDAPSEETISFNLDTAETLEELESLDPATLKSELLARGLKCGGSPQERAARLWKVRGIRDPANYPKDCLPSTRQRKRPAPDTQGPRKATAGPLREGERRRPGQKSLPGTKKPREPSDRDL